MCLLSAFRLIVKHSAQSCLSRGFSMWIADFTAHVSVEAFALFHCVYLMLARQENIGWACCQSLSIEPDLFHAHLLCWAGSLRGCQLSEQSCVEGMLHLFAAGNAWCGFSMDIGLSLDIRVPFWRKALCSWALQSWTML